MRVMNLIWRITAWILVLLLVCTACAGEPAAETTAPSLTTAAPETEQPLRERLAGYTLVRPEMGTQDLLDTVLKFRSELSALVGTDITIVTDWVKRGSDPDAAGEREILFGATNRTASVEAMTDLAAADYVIRTVGEDIVVLGGSDYALAQAAKQCIALLEAGEPVLDYTYRYADHQQEGDVMLRAASYNIRHGADVNMDMKVLAADITGLNIDVVGLQEVDQNAKRSGYIDTMKLLSEASGMQYYAFAKGIPLGSGEYGTGILSRWPIISFEVTPLESGTHEQRSIGHAVLDVNGTQVHFFNTHLSYEDKGIRGKQFAQIAEMLPKDESWLLTGDFNTADFSEFAVLNYTTMLNRPGNQKGSYYSNNSAIDNIVMSGGWEIIEDGMLEVKHSDHYMIWCEAYLKGEKK